MDATVMAALIGAAASLIVAYLSTIGTEAYKHFKEGTAMAAALLGEINSYRLAHKSALPPLKRLAESAASGSHLDLPKPGRHSDLVFEANVGRLGLLGADALKDLVLLYHQVRAYRSTFELACDAPQALQGTLLTACTALLDNADSIAPDVVAKLEARYKQGFLRWVFSR